MITDHSSLLNIIKSEKEIPTVRLQKFVEKLSRNNFDMYHEQGKEMHISDFLSRASFEPESETPAIPPMPIENNSMVCYKSNGKKRETINTRS